MKNFIICLSKIPASLETAINLKNQFKEFGAEAELFEGTYGNDAVKLMEEEERIPHPFGIKGPSSLAKKYCNYDEAWAAYKDSKMNLPGVKGCFYSHYNLWKKCVELDEPIVIWEDDIVLTRPYMPIDWKDVLILALGHPTKSQGYLTYFDKPDGDPYAAPYRQSSMPGCCGYAIKPHAANKLVDTYYKTFLPADNAINKYHVEIEIHNYIMGMALVKKDGKKSLTRTNFWNNFN